jgi:hypothetical protein
MLPFRFLQSLSFSRGLAKQNLQFLLQPLLLTSLFRQKLQQPLAQLILLPSYFQKHLTH